MKLWEKGTPVNKKIELFTVGNDQYTDLVLAPYDVLGSIAHARMLESINLLSAADNRLLIPALIELYHQIENGRFTIEDGIEDVHSQVELMLTRTIGDAGKKIHSGRSRNDQVLLDIKLFLRDAIRGVVENTTLLFHLLIRLSEQHKDKLMPGYTHFQVAMPSSFGLWFGAYAESLSDDLLMLRAAYQVVNQNPLGSAAGFGSSFPLNRTMTTQLLGFDDLSYNSVYAQMGRGKAEKITASALAFVAATLSRMAMDICLFMNQNYGFVSFPDELTTGSSIMPHKKNPDVFELIRAKGNRIQSMANEISLVTANLPSGYHRDMQVIKEILFPAFASLNGCLEMSVLMLENIRIADNIITDQKYSWMFSVEEVNKLVLQGIPFREAYKTVGKWIEEGKFKPELTIRHTHEGSIGNLCNDRITEKYNKVLAGFAFDIPAEAIRQLLKP